MVPPLQALQSRRRCSHGRPVSAVPGEPGQLDGDGPETRKMERSGAFAEDPLTDLGTTDPNGGDAVQWGDGGIDPCGRACQGCRAPAGPSPVRRPVRDAPVGAGPWPTASTTCTR